MLGGMVSLCSLTMCLRTISEDRKRSPQMRQCHWSRAKMYGRHSELFGSSLGSGILIISRRRALRANITRSRRYRSDNVQAKPAKQFDRATPSGGRDALARAAAWVAYERHQAVLTRGRCASRASLPTIKQAWRCDSWRDARMADGGPRNRGQAITSREGILRSLPAARCRWSADHVRFRHSRQPHSHASQPSHALGAARRGARDLRFVAAALPVGARAERPSMRSPDSDHRRRPERHYIIFAIALLRWSAERRASRVMGRRTSPGRDNHEDPPRPPHDHVRMPS